MNVPVGTNEAVSIQKDVAHTTALAGKDRHRQSGTILENSRECESIEEAPTPTLKMTCERHFVIEVHYKAIADVELGVTTVRAERLTWILDLC